MTELTFTKHFLSALNGRSLKLGPDHIDDPKTYTRPPHTLPKPPTYPPTKKPRLEDSPKITLTLKTLRPPHITFTAPPLSLSTTTLLTPKLLLSNHTSIPLSKLKILYKGKVLPDVTFLREIFGDEPPPDGGVLNVMLMGGVMPKAGSGGEGEKMELDVDVGGRGKSAKEEEERKKGEGEGEKMDLVVDVHGDEKKRVGGLLDQEEFWEELKEWLGTKVGSGDVTSEEIAGVFREAWAGRK